MFCNNCGSEIQEEANFCWKCGKPQKSGFQADEPKWETCEIMCELISIGGIFTGSKYKYLAKAIGPKGVYIISQTPPVTDVETEKAIDVIIKKLTSDNWEPTGRGEQNWNYKFRRRVT